MIRIHRIVILAVFLVLNSDRLVHADTLVREPTADAQLNLNPTQFVHNGLSIVVESDSSSVESIGLLEFDIAELDPSQTILSASLEISLVLATGQFLPEARASIYDGVDGDIWDVDIDPALNAPLSGLKTVELGTFSIELEPAHVQALVDANSDYLGVVLSITQLSHNYGFATIEWTDLDPAQLTIEYVPEPATIVLLGIGLFALLLTVRRRR